MGEEEIEWHGKSGKKYSYWIYKIGTSFKSVPGNYIFARETEKGRYRPIYIGQTCDLSERFDNHHKMPCIIKNGTTNIHVHKSSEDESIRISEETDLIDNWNPICND